MVYFNKRGEEEGEPCLNSVMIFYGEHFCDPVLQGTKQSSGMAELWGIFSHKTK